MRDYRNAKAMAQTLREDLAEKSIKLTHSESLELVSRILGFRDWNVLAAKMEAEREAQAASSPDAQPHAASTTLFCSFCGKSQHEVQKLIAGPDVFICDACVALCDDVLLDTEPAMSATVEDLRPRSTEELIVLKVKLERGLSTSRALLERLRPLLTASFDETAKQSPPLAYFLRKPIDQRQAQLRDAERRIAAMEGALAMTREVLRVRTLQL